MLDLRMTKIDDLAYCVMGEDTVRVEQSCGTGESYVVDLHRIHLQHLASKLGLLDGDANAWRRVATLERRLRVLTERIRELNGRLWGVQSFPPDSIQDDPDLWYSEATVAIAEEFCADLPGEPVSAPSMRQEEAPRLGGPTQTALPLEVQS